MAENSVLSAGLRLGIAGVTAHMDDAHDHRLCFTTNLKPPHVQTALRLPLMRLAAEQVDHIVTAAREFFGPQARVWLLGSRTDDTRRGGDIDSMRSRAAKACS